MKETNRSSSNLGTVLLVAGIVTTLAVWLSLADPINIPKMFLLTLLAAWILGGIVLAKISQGVKNFSLGEWALFAFMVAILLAGVLTDEPYTGLFGAQGRNDGAISYLAMALLAFATIISFSTALVRRYRFILVYLGAFLTFYGLLQTTGTDPLHWNIVYSPVMGTLGNPDFLSALLGACAIATLWTIFIEDLAWMRISGSLLIVLELFVIRRSGSMQGFLVVALGFSILGVAKLWTLKKEWGQGLLGLAVVGFIPVFLGLLNKGPFAAHLYRGSIQSRIDYWHAALSMFKAHPLLGVGLDRFGENYWQYAPTVQVVENQATNNAHNVFLQLLSTGGLLVIVPYLFLLTVIFVAGVRGVLRNSGKAQFEILALFTVWFALLLVSAISIDNLGVSVWFWISGGVLYWTSRQEAETISQPVKGKSPSRKVKGRKSNENANYLSPVVSGILVIIALVVVLPTWRASATVMDLQRNSGGLSKTEYIAKLQKTSKAWPANPQTLVVLADFALRISEPDSAIPFIELAAKKDPKSANAQVLGAAAYEMKLQYAKAVPYRIRLMKLNPWNSSSEIQLIKDYLALKDTESARRISQAISDVKPNSDDAKAAALLLKG